MIIFESLIEWRRMRQSISPTLSLGFVPTMGNLHAGHMSLVDASQHLNDRTAVSIFINRMQFHEEKDFIHYPRTLEADLHFLEQKGVDYCLLPSEDDMYRDKQSFQIQENDLSKVMEGKYRPGHFNGVLTIVMKFFQLVRPKHVYFGEKDYQQYLLIRDMIQAFFMDIEIHACPTLREKSGLACSSRNNRLTPEEKVRADLFAKIFHQNKLMHELNEDFDKHQIKVEYLEEHFNRRFIAVKIGDVRLIDNYNLYC